MKLQPLHIDLITIAAAVVAVLLAFGLIGFMLRKILRWTTAAPAMKRFEPAAKVLRQNLRLLLLLAGTLSVLAVIGAGAFLMYRGEPVLDYTMDLAREVPPGFWVALGIGAAKSVGLVVVAAVALRLVRRVLRFSCERAKAFEGIRANDESVEQLFSALGTTVGRATWLLVLVQSASFLGLPTAVQGFLIVLLKIYLIIALGLIAWRSLDAVIASLDALSRKYSHAKNLMRYYDNLSPLIPALRRTVEFVIYVLVAMLVLQQVDAVAAFAEWGPRLIRVIGIIFLARVFVEVANLLTEEMLIRRAKLKPEERQRRLTIVPLIKSIVKYGIYFSAAIMVIKALGYNPTPVLAGAGILGLAVGLGAQNLINDIVSGFFILFENYYLVGDFVEIGEAEGVVEAIELRATRVRDASGRLHIIRNGQIDSVVNYSKEYTYAVVEVGVAYESDLEHVVATLQDVGQRVREACEEVLEPTVVQGLDNFGESELTYRTVTKVKPGCHLKIEREIRRHIKAAFDQREIEIPYARRVLIFQPNGDGDTPAAQMTVPAV